jgi:S1-C subfamily serine protease
VVGVNTAVAGVGLGLAVPIDDVTRRIIGALMSEGRFRRAYLGIAGGGRPLPPKVMKEVGRQQGVEVVQVVPGSPAAAAGIRPEDLIIDVDGKPVKDSGDLQRIVMDNVIGRQVQVRVFRDGRILSVPVVPAELTER